MARSAERIAAEKAVVLFDHFGWTWWSDEKGSPSVDDIEAHLLRLAEDMYSNPGTTAIESGRLRVEREDRENGLGTRYYFSLAETNIYSGEGMG